MRAVDPGMLDRYAAALREISSATGPFGLERVQFRHGTSYLGGALRGLGWTRATGAGTVWVGPAPGGGAELLAMAGAVVEAVRRDGRRYRERRRRRSGWARVARALRLPWGRK